MHSELPVRSQRNWWDPTYRSILINISFPDGPLEIADSIQTPSDPTFTQKSQARSFHRKSQRATKKNFGRLAATQNKLTVIITRWVGFASLVEDEEADTARTILANFNNGAAQSEIP